MSDILGRVGIDLPPEANHGIENRGGMAYYIALSSAEQRELMLRKSGRHPEQNPEPPTDLIAELEARIAALESGR